MNVKLLRGYVLAILSALILAAAGILLLNNIGGEWQMQVFWRPVRMGPAAWLLLAAGGGVVLWWTCSKLLPASISSLRAGTRQRREKRMKKDLEGLTAEKRQKPPAQETE